MEYEAVFSKRKTLAISVSADGRIVVRAPFGTSERYIEEAVEKHRQWIENALRKAEERSAVRKEASPEEEKALRKQAKEVIPLKVQHFSALAGVTPSRITVTGARTRFGSCSGKNSISFSFYLMRYPEEAIDYVVVHELCHIRHHNHSKEFYKEIEKILPDYKEREKLLRTYRGEEPKQENI